MWTLVCLFTIWHYSDAFNLEPRIPIIKQGEQGAYFGYSVALHLQVNSITNKVQNQWLLVGAPRDQNLQPNTTKSGALWKCPFTTYKRDCEQVITDGMRDKDGRYDTNDPFLNSGELSPPYKDQEIKDDQWMGVTVRSEGPGKGVLVCAHRYVKIQSAHLGQGLCYTLTQQLDFNWYYEPCSGRPVDKYHEQWGLCQAGTNGLLTGEDEVVLGAPGSYTWKGTFFAQNTSTNWLDKDKTVYYPPVKEDSSVEKYSYLGFSVAYGKFIGEKMSYVAGAPRSKGVGEVVFFEKKIRGEPKMKEQLKFTGDLIAASFGYEIAAVDFNSDGWDDLVVGAPFYHRDMLGGAIYVYMNKEGGMTADTPYILETGQMGECRFGFSLANLGDINHDGYQDLAVGAPYEGKGVVYIYHGSATGFIQKKVAQKIVSEDIPGIPPVTFGYSLSGGIDVDNNGYTDLLIGCYADDKVILLRSRPIVNIYTQVKRENLTDINPAQVHCSEDKNANTTCFSFEACFKVESLDQFRRASPLIKYEIEAETFNGAKVSRVYFRNGQVGKNNVVKGDIKLRSHVAHEFHCNRELVYLKKEGQPYRRFDIQSPIEFKLSYSLGEINPVYYEGGSIPEMGEYPVLNQKEAVKYFTASFLKNCASKICESNLRVYGRLNLTAGEDDVSQMTLGIDEKVVLDVDVENDGDPAYMAFLVVENTAGMQFKTHPSKDSQCLRVNATVVKCFLGNPFHGSGHVTLTYEPNIPYHVTRANFNITAVTTSNNKNLQESSVVLPVIVAKKVNLAIRGLSKPEQVRYGGEVIGESAMKYLEDIGSVVEHRYIIENYGPYHAEDVKIRVHWPYQVENGRPQGKWLLYLTKNPDISRGTCRIVPGQVNVLGLKSKSESSSSLSGSVRPDTTTTTTTSTTTTTTEAPDVEGGSSGGGTVVIKNVTTIVNRTTIRKTTTKEKKYYSGEKSGGSYSKSSQGSSSSSNTFSESHSRTKREQEQVILPVALTGEDGKKTNTVFMKCGAAKCSVIECVISSLGQYQTVLLTVYSRLWNSTLVEDYPDVHMVEIESKGEIVLDERLLMLQDDRSDDEAFAVTTAIPELPSDAQKGVPIWIIVVSVLAGLLLLFIIVFLFWKCGFFKRKKPDPTLAGNLEKAGLNGEYS